MQKSLEMTENENNNLISENTVLNRRLTNAVDAIRQLKSALRLMVCMLDYLSITVAYFGNTIESYPPSPFKCDNL